MKRAILVMAMAVMFVACGSAFADWKDDIQVLSAEIKSATLYSVKENQVQAGVGVELLSYKDSLEADLLFGPAKQTIGAGVSYEASIVESILNSVFKVQLPEQFKNNLTQSLGGWGGFSGVGSSDCDFDWGAYLTAARYKF